MIAFMVLAILQSNAWADVTLTDIDAAKITVDLEKGQMCSDLYVTAQKVIEEQTVEINICKDEFKELTIKDDAYAKAVVEKDKIIKDQGVACDEAIKATKGTFWERLKGNTIIFGAGSLVGIVLITVLVFAL